MAAKTSLQISERITALDLLAADLGKSFDLAAAAAVSGDEAAGKEAAEIDGRLSRLAVDRRVLERAKAQAELEELAAAEVELEAVRQGHLADARSHAVALLDVAKRADAVVEAFIAVLGDIAREETELRAALSRAGALPGGSVAYQSGLAMLALDHIKRATDGRARYQEKPRSLADTCLMAWSILLDNEGR